MLILLRTSYKAAGANATDETGALDTVEFINVAKDDALAWPGRVHREYPSTVNARMESTIKPFVQKSLEVNYVLLDVLSDRLGLPKGTLAKRHPLEEPSGSEARCIKNPPKPDGISETQAAIGAHTDFGSLVCLLTSWLLSTAPNLKSAALVFLTQSTRRIAGHGS